MPQVGSLQVMRIHLVPWHFVRLGRRCKLTEEGLATAFSSEIFFMCKSSISWGMNLRLLYICQSAFETTLLFEAVFIRHLWDKCIERTAWLQKHQLLIHSQRKISPISLLTHDANAWKTTRIDANQSAPGRVHLQFGLSSNLKYLNSTSTTWCCFWKCRMFHYKEKEVGDFFRTVFRHPGEQ